ncbi:hypothetical protein ES705_48604 [subsurface metagenome]
MKYCMCRPKIETNTKIKIIEGKAKKISIILIKIASTHPPKYADTTPTIIPKNTANNRAGSAIVRDDLAPKIILPNTSRPCSVVPR